MLRELKPFEEKMEVAKYCNLNVKKAESPVEPLDPKDAICPEDVNVLLDAQKVPSKSGYCMLDNGASYVTVKAHLPKVTKEMIQWMVSWMGLSPLNFMAINPETHHSAAVSDIDREKIGREFLSVDQKSEGIYVYSIEKIGNELEGIITSYLSPMDQGYDMQKYSSANIVSIGGYVLVQKHSESNPQKKELAEIITIVRDSGDGVDVQTHLWGGYKLLRKMAKRVDTIELQPTLERTEEIANYIANEWAQIGSVLPGLYAEMCK